MGTINKKQSNKGVLCFLILAVVLTGCISNVVKYKVPNDYVGPCMVFIQTKNSKKGINSVVVINDQGLGTITYDEIGDRFQFVNGDSEKEISIIEVGREFQVRDSLKHIFKLFKESSDSKCSKRKIDTVNFFFGSVVEFKLWEKENSDLFDYFQRKNIDWCSYYLGKN